MAVSILHAGLPFPVRNARYSVLVPNLNATGVPTDPVTPACTVSTDAGAGAASAETPTIIGTFGGGTVMTFSATEMNCTTLFAKFTEASGPGPTLLPIYPRILPIVQSGTASNGAVGSITLALTAASYSLVGAFVRTTGGTGGGGANNQVREITAYDTSTKIATVTPNFEVAPDNTTTYDILDPTQGNRFKGSVNPLWEGTLSAIAAGTITLPANHNIDHDTQLAIVLKTGTRAVGKQRYMTWSGAGEVYTVDPAWNSGSETLPTVPITAEVYSVAKAPTLSLLNVNVAQVNAVAASATNLGLSYAGSSVPTVNLNGPDSLLLHSSTAQAGTATTITLAVGASAVNGFYTGAIVKISSATGIGQSRYISGYVGATKVATVGTAWVTTPDATSVYQIIAGDNVSAIGSVTGSVGSLVGNAGIKKNAILNNFSFVMTDSTTHLPKTGVTVTAQRSLDGGAYGACANAVVEVGAGSYVINLAATDTNAVNLILKFTGTASDTQFISITTGS